MVGALYNDIVEYLAMPVYYPLRDDTEVIQMTPTFVEDTLNMISMYNVTMTRKTVDISHVYHNIPATIWILLWYRSLYSQEFLASVRNLLKLR